MNLSGRSRLDVYFEVLEAINNGIHIPSLITYEANVSWNVGSNVFDTLIRSGCIKEEIDRNYVRYYLTIKGRNALAYYLKALESLV